MLSEKNKHYLMLLFKTVVAVFVVLFLIDSRENYKSNFDAVRIGMTAGDAVMSNQAAGYVATHAIGHIFALPDLHKAAAIGPTGPNLMCSGEPICADSAHIGTYLSAPQVDQARKGLLKWVKKK